MTQLVYADVNLESFLEELKEIIPLHYDEVSANKDFPLEPDYEAYARMNAAGMLRCMTCRADGVLIGYILFVIQPHLHYKSCKTAFENMYFVKKEYRVGRTGIRLFQYAESVLRGIGVNRIIMQTKIHIDNSSLFKYLKYKLTDKVFTKILSTESI